MDEPVGAAPGLGVETHAVVGARDVKFAALAEAMRRTAPIRVTRIPDAGHALLAEAPDALADLLDHLFA